MIAITLLNLLSLITITIDRKTLSLTRATPIKLTGNIILSVVFQYNYAVIYGTKIFFVMLGYMTVVNFLGTVRWWFFAKKIQTVIFFSTKTVILESRHHLVSAAGETKEKTGLGNVWWSIYSVGRPSSTDIWSRVGVRPWSITSARRSWVPRCLLSAKYFGRLWSDQYKSSIKPNKFHVINNNLTNRLFYFTI